MILTAFASVPVAFGQSSPLLFNGDFEDGSLADYKVIGGNPVVSTERTRLGSRALKSVIDYSAMTSSFDTLRTETKPNFPVDGPYIYKDRPIIGQEYWYGFSIFLPKDFAPSQIWEILVQWHVDPDAPEERARNPPMTITTTGGKWGFRSSWDANAITQKDADGKWIYGGHNRYDLGAYETGVWTDWVVRVKWSYETDGTLEVWKNGVKVISQLNKPNCYNDVLGPYIKFGVYKGWTSTASPEPGITKRIVFHDEFRMTGANGSYAAVAPGAATPPPPEPPGSLIVN
jgi:hypothetical protein